jgi:hypothetical protein
MGVITTFLAFFLCVGVCRELSSKGVFHQIPRAAAMVDGIAAAMGFAMMQMAQMHGEYVDEYVEYVVKKRPKKIIRKEDVFLIHVKRISKSFQKDFKKFSKGFQKVFKWAQGGAQGD